MIETGYDPLQNKTVIECLQLLPEIKDYHLQRENTHNYMNQRLKVGG